MKCVILQPSYVPWRGYFHQIQKADIFVFYDDVQYDKHGWRNRNRIKTPDGARWLTIPVHSSGNVSNGTPIHAIRTAGTAWAMSHRQTLHQNYRKAPHYPDYRSLLDELYAAPPENLADFTISSTVRLAQELGIRHTTFLRSSAIPAEGARTSRLISLLKAVGATHYLSGPSAETYLEPKDFQEAGIELEYMTYSYPSYSQLHGEYDPHVSILDLMLMTGRRAPQLIWNQQYQIEGPASGDLALQPSPYRGSPE